MNQDPDDFDYAEGDFPGILAAILLLFQALLMLSVVGLGYGLFYFLTR